MKLNVLNSNFVIVCVFLYIKTYTGKSQVIFWLKNLSILVDEIEDLRSIKVPSIIVSYYSFVEEKQVYLLIELEEVNGKNVAELIIKVIGKDGYIKEEQLLGLITDKIVFESNWEWNLGRNASYN